MLKALELFGFKSFADRTRFEFPAGITVVVGPNGSGKSNIVDAIKWVLGEQSAKSLRGREMSDVIFKGSGSGRRKPANAAEATIFFENADRRLAVDTDEVQVTRRVYRSGEGDYLINGQACRLRDVKDLFRGTGLGTDAYSLIEQGKVDTLLQASAKDRRAIFEEAAGISRFKAKKVETQRRLLRVEQNLVRLADIVEEVETRLKSVRAQSSKARRYQEYTERLKQLRTETGRVDWRRLTDELAAQQTRWQQLQEQQEDERRALTQAELQQGKLDDAARELAEVLRRHESDWVQAHARVEAAKQRRDREATRVEELQEDRTRLSQRAREARQRVAELTLRMSECQLGVAQAQETYAAIQTGLMAKQGELSDIASQLDTARQQHEERRRSQSDLLRAAAVLGNQQSAVETERRGVDERLATVEQRKQLLTQQWEEYSRQLETLQQREHELATTAQQASAALQHARQELLSRQALVEQLQETQGELKSKRTAASERAKVLAELEQKQDGVGTGPRDVLQRAKRDTFGPFREVLGMVADVVQVRVEMAPLVDVALGHLAQYIVVSGSQFKELLTRQEYQPPGRVGLVFMEQTVSRAPQELDSLARVPGVLGRADRFVTADDRFIDLVQGLLHHTWFVETLADAMELRQQGYRQVRWVTRAGELVDIDGTVVVGPRQNVGGLVSRRSQLAELKRQIDEVDEQLNVVGPQLSAARTGWTELQAGLVDLGRRQDAATAAYTQQTVALQSVLQRRGDVGEARQELDSESERLQVRRAELDELLAQTQAEQAELGRQLAVIEHELVEIRQQMELYDVRYQEFLRETTSTQVELAKSEQLLEALASQLAACRNEQEERRQVAGDLQQQWERTERGRSESELLVLAATSDIAEQSWRWEQLGLLTEEARRSLADAASRRAEITQSLEKLRDRVGRRSADCHKCELAIAQLESERANLVRRVLDDYGVDLAQMALQLAAEPDAEHRNVDEEIEDLRRKISNIGAVNMEALNELDELEQRYGGLSGQYRDLVDSKEALEKIIQRINRDSRRLFQETLDAIRTNFQQLFRRVFGGGSADIVLEEGVDILEAGVDIVATPPGKHSLNISLLSGGERALTAVTLLLAIFQYRPSPFCVLDEVDGPLDEANIGRFVDVLREFLKWTRFVVVTHSKKTMTAATTLYGVTMQESGVSKRVSVQFDDVSDDGQIRDEALARSAQA